MVSKEEYEEFVNTNWTTRRPPTQNLETYNLRQRFIMCTGLPGETGEVLELLKKEERDGELDKKKLLLELGDVQYYLTRIATWYGFTLDEVMEANREKLIYRRLHGKNGKKKVAKKHGRKR